MKQQLLLLLAATLLAALITGVRRFRLPGTVGMGQFLDWIGDYVMDTVLGGKIILPGVVSLPAGTRENRLAFTLPEWKMEAYEFILCRWNRWLRY